jgi:hypothetical protein
MSEYFRDRYQGVGAIAAAALPPRSAPGAVVVVPPRRPKPTPLPPRFQPAPPKGPLLGGWKPLPQPTRDFVVEPPRAGFGPMRPGTPGTGFYGAPGTRPTVVTPELEADRGVLPPLPQPPMVPPPIATSPAVTSIGRGSSVGATLRPISSVSTLPDDTLPDDDLSMMTAPAPPPPPRSKLPIILLVGGGAIAAYFLLRRRK